MNGARNTFVLSVLVGLGLVALIAGLGWLLQERFVAPRPSAGGASAPVPVGPRPPPALMPEGAVAIVTEVDGRVERGQGQAWTPLRVGDRLSRSESIRANTGAQAALRVGDDSHITLYQETEVVVEELTPALHTLWLKAGRVRVDYPERADRVLRVKLEGGAVAETYGARSTVLRSDMAVAVATETGAVNLAAAGLTVRVGAGQQSVALDGERPSAAAPIPREVLLQVARRARPCDVVEGRVRPGTELRVEGQRARVGRDGRFVERVASRPGREAVRVWAREPGGGEKEQRVACRTARAQARPPDDDATVKFDWDHAP